MEENIASSVPGELLPEQARFEYATKKQRMVNYLVDLIVYYFLLYKVVTASGKLFLNISSDGENVATIAVDKYVIFVVSYTLLPLLYIFMEGITSGRSLGKYITGTKAVKADLSQITWKDAIIRSMIRCIPFDPLTAMFDKPLHDKWSGTVVVKKGSVVY